MTRRKRWPAPPPTPKGKVWRTVDYGAAASVTKLVPAEEVRQHSVKIMAAYDALPVFIREQMMGS